MRVYRIEHKELEVGPFRYCYGGLVNTVEHQTMPRPVDDYEPVDNPLNIWGDACYFAMPNKRSMSFWTQATLRYMHEHDFRLGVYQVERSYVRVGRSKLQAGFLILKATRIEVRLLI